MKVEICVRKRIKNYLVQLSKANVTEQTGALKYALALPMTVIAYTYVFTYVATL